MTPRPQLLSELNVVIKFAVVEEHLISGWSRLYDRTESARFEVDYGQPSHRQMDAGSPVKSGFIRPAMPDGEDHFFDSMGLDATPPLLTYDSSDSAHWHASSAPLSGRVRSAVPEKPSLVSRRGVPD